jgi:signal transduction histidine kinase
MTGKRWWDVFFAATIVVLALLNAYTWSPGAGQRIGAWVILALLAVAYVTMGRSSLNRSGVCTGPLAWPFVVILLIGCGALVACSPSLAVVQAIAFPLIWNVLARTRSAIIANALLALTTSAGFLVSLGLGADNIAQTAIVEGISLIGSLALGLWISRIADLSAERQRLLDELTATQDQLAASNRDSGATSERERLAREIHDTIAQSLTGIVMLSQRAQRDLASGNLTPVGDDLQLLEESARDTLVETRSLVAATAPVELGAGIAHALERLGERFGRETGIAVTVRADASADVGRDSEVVLLRCAQEALANVRKHSGARGVTLALTVGTAEVVLSVHDDGAGFDAGASASGFGLPGMKDRLALAGGTLAVTSRAGEGTTLIASVPAKILA